MVGEGGVEAAAEGLVGEVAAKNGGAGLGVDEVPLGVGAALDDVGAEAAAQCGEAQGVPRLAREPREEGLEVALAPAVAAQGNEIGEAAGEGFVVKLFGVRQHLAVEALDVRGESLGFVEDHLMELLLRRAGVLAIGAGEVVGVEQIQLLDGQREPQRIACRRRPALGSLRDQDLDDLGVDGAVVAAADGDGDAFALVHGERRECGLLDAVAAGEGLGLGAWDGRGDEAGILGPELRQPGQVLGAHRRLELVEGIEQQHDAPSRRGPPEQAGEGRLHLLARRRVVNRLGDAEKLRKLLNPAAQQRCDLRRAHADARGVREDEHVLILELANEVRKQGALARARDAGDARAPLPARLGGREG